MNKRKFLGTIIGVIFWSICVVFFTYAYYEWKSDNTSVVLGIQDLTIKCVKGADVNVTDIGPVFYPSDGVKAKFNLSNELADTENISISLNITSVSDNLLVESFKYMLIKESDYDNPIVEGDFSNFQEGSNTIISSLALESNTTSLYQFIVYIDGNMYNNPNMQTTSLVSYLEIGNCGLIGEANKMINSSTDNFRHADYLTNITSASFVNYIDTSNVSLDIDSNPIKWDMSTKQDNSIMAWLEENELTEDGTTYYDLYIGCKDVIYGKSLSDFFSGMTSLKSVIFENLDISLVNNMAGMFYGCSSLTSLDVSTWDTSNVTSMYMMFVQCSGLTSLDVSNWDTSKVSNIQQMFAGCNKLTSLDVSSWDTSKVTNMYGVFAECWGLTSLDVSNWNTSNAKNMGNMFAGCNTTSLDLSNWDTKNATNMTTMFNNCKNLKYLDISNFNTSKVTSMERMFSGCNNLMELDVSNFDTGNVTNMQAMFANSNKLTSLDLSSWSTSNATNMNDMFAGCSSLTSLDLSGFNTSKVTSMGSMFFGLSNLSELDLSSFDTSNVKNMSNMFNACRKLTTIYASELWSAASVTSSTNMFANATSLVGGLGTIYNSSYVDATYAKIDGGTDEPGYLTLKTA